MKGWLGWLVVCLALVLVGSYAWTHRHRLAAAVATPAPDITPQSQGTDQEDQEAEQARQMVTLTGPMANYMEKEKALRVETLQPISLSTSRRPTVVEHVGDSPVGTSRAILRKTFGVATIVDVPFELPAHASTPQLRGTYRSFLLDAESGDATADVEFLLLNQRQYGDFLNGRPAEALFSADGAHDQEVNTSMPPTLDQPGKYYLVFRNNSSGGEKKVVQADFRVDF